MSEVKIGQYLQSKREDSSTTIKVLHERSGLRRDIIQKIEANDFENLPSPEHAKFLVTLYADALDLSSERLIKEHEDEFPDVDHPTFITEAENADQKYFKRVVITFIAMIVVVFVIWIILLQIGSQADIFEPRAIYDTTQLNIMTQGVKIL
ncbi:helix-turn-helix domain-containing protein [Aliicoccus persicus]|uniref:Helix-turn-helix domain-containing protein n=1 Tax=Aliicoccus persicus TaxID=930138 RepID=A0A662Z1Z0_9STAP|nr:helix-turn-helix domain-containing protein [Aliicoccus persicus]SEV82039.1 Helix-turn-helix domain-containing protein [Aliicoccus persicus]